MNELEVINPVGKQIKIKDENLTITPFKFGELPRVFRAVDPILVELTNALQHRNNHAAMLSALMASAGDNVLDLITVGVRKPREWVEQLDSDEGLELFAAVLEVNVDFFVKKVLPRLNKTLEAVVPGQTQ